MDWAASPSPHCGRSGKQQAHHTSDSPVAIRAPTTFVPEVAPDGGAGALQRVLDVMSCGYPEHPFVTVHAKIIFLMKANTAVDG